MKNYDNFGSDPTVATYNSHNMREDYKDVIINELKNEVMDLRQNQQEISKMNKVLLDLEKRCNNYERERVNTVK